MANLITNVNQACADLTNIKKAITDKGVDVANGTPSSEYANKVDEVYEAGKKAEYDAFWDAFQDNGKRVNYTYGFAGAGWNDRTFRPKYNMRPDWAIISMFNGCAITDLEKILNDCGVTLDTSNNGNYASAFSCRSFTVLPEIVFGRNTSQAGQVFSNCTSLHIIRKVTFTEGATAVWTSVFENCIALANVVFAGVVANNINLQWCPLTRASIESLFSVLSDTVSGKTVTINKTAKEAAFTADEWAELIATKTNWTISLV